MSDAGKSVGPDPRVVVLFLISDLFMCVLLEFNVSLSQ